MTVRFKEQYSESNPPIAYELVSDEPIEDYNEDNGQWEPYYSTKLLGLVPCWKMEITIDPNDILAIDVFVKLSNM